MSEYNNKFKIPADFMVGTSSSAWQIEGTFNKKEGQESWAELFYNYDKTKWHNEIGPEVTSDFYHHYKEDIKTMASYGLNTFRFTIQWARFMEDPFLGIVSEEAVSFYQDVIDTIKENNMIPVISLEHWDIPASIILQLNGWANRKTVDLYEMYVEKALERFSKDVKLWFAFTEPNIPIDNGYMDKKWYPFTHDPKTAYQAHYHKILATSIAVRCIEKYRIYGCKMGAMVHFTPVYARSGEIRDVMAAYYADLFQVRLYLDPYLTGTIPAEIFTELEKYDCLFTYEQKDLDIIKKYQIDILGVDYYFPIRVKARESKYEGLFHPEVYYEPWIMPDRKFNADRGWEIYEKAIYDIGMRIKNDYGNKDWFISENGIGIENEERFRNKQGIIEDDYRIDFISEHLRYTLKAKEEGSNVHGYLIWSFVDNLSAINAFKNRYGLLELDLNTGKRIPKKSIYYLKEVMKNKEI